MAYSPKRSFPFLAHLFLDLEEGNGQMLAEMMLDDLQAKVNATDYKGQNPMIRCLDTAVARLKNHIDTRQNDSAFSPLRQFLQDVEKNNWTCKHRNVLPPPSQQFTGTPPRQSLPAAN
jgi:hypothetical protein